MEVAAVRNSLEPNLHMKKDRRLVWSQAKTVIFILIQVASALVKDETKVDAETKLPGISMAPRAQVEIDGSTLLHIILTETDTFCLLDIPSICVSSELTEEATAVKANNAKYKEVS